VRFMEWAPDGARDANLWGFYFIEIKPLFSIVLLRFKDVETTPEAFHTHAFNAWTIWLSGAVLEEDVDGNSRSFFRGDTKYTPRSKFHRITAMLPTWALCFRGPWADKWKESRQGKQRTLTHGRKEVEG
jgi:hypothetical protein